MPHFRPNHKTNARGRPNVGTEGQRIWKRITIRVVLPGNKGFAWRPVAGPRKGFRAEDIQGVLEKCADHLEKKFPNFDFELVELEPNRFNMVFVRERNPAPARISAQEVIEAAQSAV